MHLGRDPIGIHIICIQDAFRDTLLYDAIKCSSMLDNMACMHACMHASIRSIIECSFSNRHHRLLHRMNYSSFFFFLSIDLTP